LASYRIDSVEGRTILTVVFKVNGRTDAHHACYSLDVRLLDGLHDRITQITRQRTTLGAYRIEADLMQLSNA